MNDTRRPLEGVPMTAPPDPEVLARERAWLTELESAPASKRWWAFLRNGGPGYLQSALTLGGGSASAGLFAGAAFGYELLWVAPVSMLFGIIMMSAVAHQTLSTGLRPFDAVRTYAGPFFAWGWALGALISSFIWHFAQYSLASAMLQDIGAAMDLSVERFWMGLLVLAWATATAMMYGSTPKSMRVFERILQFMVYGIIVCFGIVVLRTGIQDVGAFFRGFIPFQFPESTTDVQSGQVVVAGLAAAVGANMLFLYPYTLLARGWGREHRRLARFDLLAGMFFPYLIAMTLMVIATANTLHADGSFTGSKLSPVEASGALAEAVGPTAGRIIFGLGVLGMAMSSITLQMLCSGFACSEMFGWKVGSMKYRLACLIPAPGVLGSVFWGDIAIWMAVPTTVLCGFLLPIAYVGFIKLQRNKDYLGEDMPTGSKGSAWWGGMILTTLVLVVFLGWFAVTKVPGWFENLAS